MKPKEAKPRYTNSNECISIKASSKKDIYCMLKLECDVYLPPIPQANHGFVSGINSGSVKVWH